MAPQELCLQVDQFLRLFPMRAPQIAWLLGAGASASGGVKTASHMIWEFKRSIYCSQQRVPISACSDLSDPVVLDRVQSYFDSTGLAPSKGSDEEYSYFFEAAWPNEADRQRYIRQLAQNAAPWFGHVALAALMKLDKVRCIWTTNFDSLVEDAVARVYQGTASLTTATLESADLASQAITNERWPLLVKLHGDFRSRRLKNTTNELQIQNAKLQDALVQSMRWGGVAVVGYSGRDRSVMTALHDAIANGNGYPSGLFWFYRPITDVSDSVVTLIQKARSVGIDAHLVPAETFDELLADILYQLPDMPPLVQQLLDSKPTRLTLSPVKPTTGHFPVLRFNAFPVLQVPSVCRRVECTIGGAVEVQKAVRTTGVPVLVGRRKVGVIAFGDDSDVRKCFESYGITAFDLHAIEFHRLRYDSAEHGLLAEALWRAISRERPVRGEAKGRGRWFTVDPHRTNDPEYLPLKKTVQVCHGELPGSHIPWREAVKFRLVAVGNDVWMMVEPSVWFDLPETTLDETQGKRMPPEADEFARKRAAGRYNKIWNALLDGWAQLLIGREPTATLRALGCQAGVDAEFTIGRTNGFSWRG